MEVSWDKTKGGEEEGGGKVGEGKGGGSFWKNGRRRETDLLTRRTHAWIGPNAAFLKRSHVPNNKTGNSFVQGDFKVGGDVQIFGRTFHIFDCDGFTRDCTGEQGASEEVRVWGCGGDESRFGVFWRLSGGVAELNANLL